MTDVVLKYMLLYRSKGGTIAYAMGGTIAFTKCVGNIPFFPYDSGTMLKMLLINRVITNTTLW